MDRGLQRGQATAEYVAVVAVLAVLIAGAAAVATGGGGGVANAVVGQMRRALCAVTGAACIAERADPCVVSADEERRHHSLTIAIIRVDDDHVLLRERLSDGTVRLTIAEHNAAGVEVGLGSRFRLELNGQTFAPGGSLRGALLALFGDGRVFYARSEREADDIQDRVMSGELPLGLDRPYRVLRDVLGGGDDRPKPAEVYAEGGVRALGKAGYSRLTRGNGRLEALSDSVIGARHDRRRKQVTVYMRTRRAGALVASVLGSGVRGDLDAGGLLALTLDRRTRRPVALTLNATGAVGGDVRVPAPLATLLKIGGVGAPERGSEGRRWELDARLDLDDPGARIAWAAFRRSPASPAALARLGARLRDRARLDVRSYGTDEERDDFAAGISAGPGFGVEADRSEKHSRLLSASTRPPGGAWEGRTDCGAR